MITFIPQSLIDFLRKLNPKAKAVVVVALCPNFDDPSRKTAEMVSKTLQRQVHSLLFRFKEEVLT